MFNMVFASISIGGLKDNYNLGEQISPTVNIIIDSYQGLLGIKIVCPKIFFDFFKIPLTIETSFDAYIPSLPINEKMLGSCYLEFALEDMFNDKITEKSSSFTISDKIIAEITSSFDAVPSMPLTITGNLYNIRKEQISGNLTISFLNDNYNVIVSDTGFSFDLPIPYNIISGEHRLLLSFKNGENNKDILEKINIIPLASSINLENIDKFYLPYDKVMGKVTILDQANEEIKGELSVKLSGNSIFLEQDNSEFQLNNSFAPGKYTITATHSTFDISKSFEVVAISKIESGLNGNIVSTKNTGNIIFKNETTVILKDKEKEIKLIEKIKLVPSEIFEFDLSKEVPEGNYQIVLPDGTVVDNVFIDDQRSFLKKASFGLSVVTGKVVSAVEHNNKILGIIIFFAIVLVEIGVLEFLGYPIVETAKKTAGNTFKRFKKN